MKEIYEFKAELFGFEKLIFRNIEISSADSVQDLAYALEAAFECTGVQFYRIEFNNVIYEPDYGIPELGESHVYADPEKTKISDLNMSVGDSAQMVYDFDFWWQIPLTLVGIRKEEASEEKYPQVIGGMGKGIPEEYGAVDLRCIIEETEKTQKAPCLMLNGFDAPQPWDYRKFSTESCNASLKERIAKINGQY